MLQITVLICYVTAGGLWLRPRGSAAAGIAPWLISAVAVAGHAYLLWGSAGALGAGAGGTKLSLGGSLSGLGLALGTFALLLATRQRLRSVAGGLAIGAGIISLGTLLSTTLTQSTDAVRWQLMAHIGLSLTAAALFTVAAVMAVLVTVKDRRLRKGVAALGHLPPLETIERGMFGAVAIGFALLSLAIFSGLGFVSDLREQHLTHKTILTLLAWFVYGGLLLSRWRYGLRGRRATRWTLGGFTALLLAYFGSRFVLEVLLGRQWG